MKNRQDMEQIINLTYPGLRLLVRDANLRRAAEKYAIGMLLHQPGETEASLLCGGLCNPHRYAILSNHFLEASEPADHADPGLCSIPAGAHFKVLDVYRKKGSTQVALLHLPKAHWRFFEDVSTNLDELLVDYLRKRFDHALMQPPYPALMDIALRKRMDHLVGMTDLGAVYPPGE